MKKKPELTPIEQQAEDIVRAMVSESWNESIETVAQLLRETAALKAAVKDACLNLGAELAMATNALPSRRVAGLMAAFSELEAIVEDAPLSPGKRAVLEAALEQVGEKYD